MSRDGSGPAAVKRDRRQWRCPVTDRHGAAHVWLLRADEWGRFRLVDLDTKIGISPWLWGPMALRGWLLRNGLTPAGSQSAEWARQVAAVAVAAAA